MEKKDLDDILHVMLHRFGADISDFNFSVGKPLQVEFEGALTKVELTPQLAREYLSPYQTSLIALSLIGQNQGAVRALASSGSCDLAYQLRKEARFRVNIFTSRGNCTVVMRKLTSEVPSLATLKAPAIFAQIIKEKNGLVLVTGATGSGKSTTLAAMLREVNEQQAIHVVTLEDPIEFVHANIKATFNQRELGSDFDSFSTGLRAALRQAPKIILVGEMRDRATLEIGLMAAETGHLVLSTLHTVDAGQTINRIIGMFDKDEEEQVRTRLAETLRWVVCQRLVRKVGGGRIAVHEIMGNNMRVAEIIEQGEDEIKNYYNVIEASEPLGWQTFESKLLDLYRKGLLSEEDALLNSTRKSFLRQRIDYVKSQKGEQISSIDHLRLDVNYEIKAKSLK